MADLRIAILDSDAGFVRVLVKRAGDLGWQYRCLEAPPPVEEFVAMRVNALVVDLAVVGPSAWEFLERVTGALPGLGVVVCTGRSSVAQRVRGLRMGADDWVTKPWHPEELMARGEGGGRGRQRGAGGEGRRGKKAVPPRGAEGARGGRRPAGQARRGAGRGRPRRG